MPNSPSIVTALFAVVTVFGAGAVGVYGALQLQTPSLSASLAHTPLMLALNPDTLSAEAAVLYDIRTGHVLYQKEANKVLPLASLTKMMAAEVVLSKRPPTMPVQIRAEHLAPEGDSGLKVGQTFHLSDLIRLSLIASSNDAITAAASTLGPDPIAAMNAAAQDLGLTKTQFFNASGLDIDRYTSGAYGSAYDVARLAARLFRDHPDFFELTSQPEVQVETDGRLLKAAATALPLQSIPGFVAAKTGYTDLAGGNLVAIVDLEPGVTVVAVALGSTRDARFSDVEVLIATARISL